MGTEELTSPESTSQATRVSEGSGQLLHAGTLAHTAEGAALCFLTFCQAGFSVIGPHQHPDVTLDCIAVGRSLHAWDRGDYASIRMVLSQSTDRLVGAGADFFVCPCNTAHLALEQPGAELALPGLHIADVAAPARLHQLLAIAAFDVAIGRQPMPSWRGGPVPTS